LSAPIICCEVLEHLAFNPIPVVRELKRILKPGGIIYIATPNLTSLVHRVSLMKGRSFYNPPGHFVWALNPASAMSVGLHWKEYTKTELLTFFKLEGMRCVRHYYCRYVKRTTSSFLRRALVGFIYWLFPSFMQCQVAIFAKD
jgi:2-polyprenyl-3-methyl-5-hydroxy-6-metoxy-1,4-benzoquinol methylase